MTKIRKQLLLLLLAIILLVPAIHKVIDTIPPNWFVSKFESSILNTLPFAIPISYYLIIFLEAIGGLLFLMAFLQLIRNKESKKMIQGGFLCAYVLFIILTFGSFLVQDYDNGFKDFMYCVGFFIIERFALSEHELSNTSL